MKIRILPSARRDLEDGYEFYEFNESGLGNYFLHSLIAEIESLQVFAGIHSVVYGKHRSLAKRFPYSIYYLIEDNEILIYAVLDNRRDPAWTSRRIN
jgi:plasmid stabilization system protein ParE